MKTTWIVTLALAIAATPAVAGQKSSQHPRVGQLAAVDFAHGSAELAVRSDTELARDLGEVAAWAAENPDGLLVLDGHADRSGPSRVNKRLSLERAKFVRERLVALDVDPNQIVIAAFGETGPKSTRNRKVVVWGTRAGLKAVAARSHARGEPVLTAGLLSRADLAPQPGAVAKRSAPAGRGR
jgi:outer membrane protein OmpA-like peptidoglycan-associated protein